MQTNGSRDVDRTRNDGLQPKVTWFQSQCREHGLRVTPQRLAVYQALIGSDDHPSAESVFRSVRQVLPNISMDTVNRTLLTLHEMGAAFTVEGSGDAKRYDGHLEDHQHFKCLRCKKIVDIHDEIVDDIQTPAVLNDFTVLRKTVYFEGVCNSCKSQSQERFLKKER